MAFKKICSINNLLIELGKKKKKVAAVAWQLYKLIYLIQIVLQGPFKQRKNTCKLSEQEPSLFRIIFVYFFRVFNIVLLFFYTSGVSPTLSFCIQTSFMLVTLLQKCRQLKHDKRNCYGHLVVKG